MLPTNPLPLHRVIAQIVPTHRWVPITFLVVTLTKLGRPSTRQEIHAACDRAVHLNAIARRRRTNRTFQFRGLPFTPHSVRP